MGNVLYCLCASFRRFADCFGKLRLDHRRMKNARNPESLSEFEKEVFTWPVKETSHVFTSDTPAPSPNRADPPVAESDRSEERRVTMSGRPTGNSITNYI